MEVAAGESLESGAAKVEEAPPEEPKGEEAPPGEANECMAPGIYGADARQRSTPEVRADDLRQRIMHGAKDLRQR